MTDNFRIPAQLATRAEVLSTTCPVPAAPGVYGWWFRTLPAELDISQCARSGELTLLYTGISPGPPPTNGRAPSSQTIRDRIKTHYRGNAAGSTLRKTLGCLLAVELGIELRRVGSGTRMTFGPGEQALSAWLGEHALVSWVVHERPWELEDELIAALDVPLNLKGNARNAFHPILTIVLADAAARAHALPVLPNRGVGGL